MTQTERVIDALIRAREKGINSFWGYKNYIPRLGAIIFNLRQNGFEITSVKQKNHSCQYILKSISGVLAHQGEVKEVPKKNLLQKIANIFKRQK